MIKTMNARLQLYVSTGSYMCSYIAIQLWLGGSYNCGKINIPCNSDDQWEVNRFSINLLWQNVYVQAINNKTTANESWISGHDIAKCHITESEKVLF